MVMSPCDNIQTDGLTAPAIIAVYPTIWTLLRSSGAKEVYPIVKRVFVRVLGHRSRLTSLKFDNNLNQRGVRDFDKKP